MIASVALCIMNTIVLLNYMCLPDSVLLSLEGFDNAPAESKASCLDLYKEQPLGQNLYSEYIHLSEHTYTIVIV